MSITNQLESINDLTSASPELYEANVNELSQLDADTSPSSTRPIDQVDSPAFSQAKNRKATVINGTIITLGDSLSDGGNEHGKYNQTLSGAKIYPYLFNRKSSNK